ncbi:adenine-specific DNA-methyltransferase [Meinhardsimonia xiamenensis]|jgi:adenine-specific DNA-methyltransferase|uniref:site-specific DNA-methyltransferase (adenine-specific) n=1 Tax=Meinhardsimonia xiamenensis TaxID=990712 RepID=A0A1G9HLC3_9RHOB|nr:site-specific DNA-methyltransferase [Meinhardsimonia xiamenensis]PRX27493.1 adenine-specific DNA-methyltransferase [Meinhardsimonia xiamenensis]SDL13682.1 adenine-specific DNA-methyltransferase [Meinhardsimonia xiamenensis]
MARKPKKPLEVEALKHEDATRKNIPTAEFESIMREQDKAPVRLAIERRNRDLDPQLVWRGKDEQDWSDLIVQAPPLYIQEKVHPKALIEDLKRISRERAAARDDEPDLFADFNGLPDAEAATEFYQHDAHWSNRMIVGDSLSVMASLAEREGLRGQVQCIYLDPPYGIKFNSNFQWSTTSRDVKDGKLDNLTREPEQVRAFRDTWRDGIHSYLTYLRDRLTVARDLLSESGSCFVQIGSENVHLVQSLMGEVFGTSNAIATIRFKRGGFQTSAFLPETHDFIVWFGKNKHALKFRRLFASADRREAFPGQSLFADDEAGFSRRISRDEIDQTIFKVFRHRAAYSATGSASSRFPVLYNGKLFIPSGNRGWSTNETGMLRAARSMRLFPTGNTLERKMYFEDSPFQHFSSSWDDTISSGFGEEKVYVVQTQSLVVQRCILMSTDPGDLVLDPTCGSGTTAYVAEQWGRRWITIDTSRVAIALARSRLMGARYPFYLLADSPEGQQKEAELRREPPKTTLTHGSLRQGFVYERVPHITLKSIANNAEIDVIWERMQPAVEDARAALNAALAGHPTPFKVETGGRAGQTIDFTASGEVTLPSGEKAPANGFMEWEIPREAPADWPEAARQALERFWRARIARQKEIDASIAAKAEFEYLYDKPYVDKSKVRVAGPFTVESLSPHRTLAVDWDDELIDLTEAAEGKRQPEREGADDFAHMILQNLKAAGVQQAHKEDRITFTSLVGWPGRYICAEGTFMEGDVQRRAGIFIGPEFGTVSRPDLVAAAREAGEAGFDVLIACAFNYDAHSAEFDKLGRVPVLKARMNPDLHMGGDLKATGAGNLFVIFGEPDIRIEEAGEGMIRVKVFGVDVFKPQTGEIVSEGTDGIALWMLDTDYNEESFFVRHAYFLGANDPYKALKTTLKAEIDEEAWASLYSDTSRPFPKPKSGRIAVKVINHLGDEVMKVFAVE